MFKLPLACISGLVIASSAAAEPTQVVVRVISQDGKFIGDHTGGASVTLRDAKTGRVLARGSTKGGTGNTDRIMAASGRSPTIVSADAASYETNLDVDMPTLVDVEVEGPLGRPQSKIRVRSQRWILPGVPMAGNGWMIELPGLAITPSVARNGQTVSIEAKVELMCGCPITPDGPWRSGEYDVAASIWRGRHKLASVPLAFTKSPGTFTGRIALPPSPDMTIYMTAVNSRTGNSGMVISKVH